MEGTMDPGNLVRLMEALAKHGAVRDLELKITKEEDVGMDVVISQSQHEEIVSAFKGLTRLKWLVFGLPFAYYREPQDSVIHRTNSNAFFAGIQQCPSLETVQFFTLDVQAPKQVFNGFIDFVSWSLSTSSSMKHICIDQFWISIAVLTSLLRLLTWGWITKPFDIGFDYLSIEELDFDAVDTWVRALRHTTVDISLDKRGCTIQWDRHWDNVLNPNLNRDMKTLIEKQMWTAHEAHVANRKESARNMMRYTRHLLLQQDSVLPPEILRM
ncbi:hypothetical protein HK102_009495, partial [Quaeritorhiza haematococci]